MNQDCVPCAVAVREAEGALGLTLDMGPLQIRQRATSEDGVAELWDDAWSLVHARATTLTPVDLVDRIVRDRRGVRALDRHAVESDAEMATADDLLRGAVVRTCVDAFVSTWVAQHDL